MRFILFDRVVELKKGHGAILIKNVSQSEDYFMDHFPGFPVVPGSIILGSFEQGAELLLGATYDFKLRPVLQRVTRASFRHFVVPGDQLELHLTLSPDSPTRVQATAKVREKRVADARFDFSLQETEGNSEALEACQRLKLFYDLLNSDPLTEVWDLWAGQKDDGGNEE